MHGNGLSSADTNCREAMESQLALNSFPSIFDRAKQLVQQIAQSERSAWITRYELGKIVIEAKQSDERLGLRKLEKHIDTKGYSYHSLGDFALYVKRLHTLGIKAEDASTVWRDWRHFLKTLRNPLHSVKPFDRQLFYKLLSAFHNRVREHAVIQSILVGLNLWEMNPNSFLKQIDVLTFEEAPSVVQTIQLIRQRYEESDDKDGVGRLMVGEMCKVLAEAKKDRRVDELLHMKIAAEKDWKPAKVVYDTLMNDALSKEPTFTEKDLASHLSNGYEFMVREKSRCANLDEAYAKWTPFWVELVANAPITKDDLKPVVHPAVPSDLEKE